MSDGASRGEPHARRHMNELGRLARFRIKCCRIIISNQRVIHSDSQCVSDRDPNTGFSPALFDMISSKVGPAISAPTMRCDWSGVNRNKPSFLSTTIRTTTSTNSTMPVGVFDDRSTRCSRLSLHALMNAQYHAFVSSVS